MHETQALIKNAQLDQALEAAIEDVKAKPANLEARTFLFQVLLALGDTERAAKHLKVARQLSAEAIPMEQTYLMLMACDNVRKKVFAGETYPAVLGEPTDCFTYLVKALQHDALGEVQQAYQLRQAAFDAAQATSGTINGKPFAWIADADSRIGPNLEIAANGSYYWVPFERISKVAMEEPEDLRDLVWAPAQLTLTNNGQLLCFIPVRYPGSAESGDGALQLAYKTVWQALHEDHYMGLGQKLFTTDDEDVSLLDLRTLTLESTLDFSEE